jgi:hypothetical protein
VLADHLRRRLADDAHRLRVQVDAVPLVIGQDDAVTEVVDYQPELLGDQVLRPHSIECGATSSRRDIRDLPHFDVSAATRP